MKNPTITYSGKAGDFKAVRSMITIMGDSEALIENCRRIIECNEIKCGVESAGYIVEVWGSGLTVTSYANGSAGVAGRISSVSISRRPRAVGKEEQ